MLNACTKVLWRCKLIKQNFKVIALTNYATFTVRDVVHDASDEAGTLLMRFAKHVALERQKVCDQVPSTVKYSDYFPVSDVRYFQKELVKTNKEQIAAVIIFAFTYRSNADPGKFAIILNDLDRHAVNKITEMNVDTILRTLYAFLFLMPNWMTRLDFYGQAMQVLFEEFNKQELETKEHFVQLCFYMGLNKKQTKHNVKNLLHQLLNKHLDKYLPQLDSLDLALVSNAAYKTSLFVQSEEFNNRLLKEVLNISNTSNGNDALLVNFTKSMRLQRVRSSRVCEYIENICQNKEKLQQLEARGQIHLFAYLAENLWDNELCTQPIIEGITEQLTLSRKGNGCYGQIIRGKDISNFLWSCAQLNCSLSSVQFRTIENTLLHKLDAGEFNYFVDQLVDSCLSLWMLGYKAKQLLQAAVKLKSASYNKNSKQPKVENRLTVLLSAAQIEEPSWCSNVIKGFEAFNPTAKIPTHLLNNQDITYQKIIEELLKEEFVASARLSCPINGINIPGVHVKFSSTDKSDLFLEFLTPLQTLHFSQEPTAILRLKLRLLQSLGHKIQIVSSTDAFNPKSINDAPKDIDMQEEFINEPSKSSVKA